MMKRKRSLFLCLSSLFVLAIVLAGCGGGGGTVPSAETATISGVITGSSPNLLIPGATVTATGGGRTFTAVAGADGRYSLHLPAGSYTLTAAKETFNEATAAIEVAAGAAATRDFALTTGSGGTPGLPQDQDFFYEYYIYTGPAEFAFRGLAKSMKGPQVPLYPPPAAKRQMEEEYVYGFELYGEMSWLDALPAGAVGIRVYAGDAAAGPFVLLAAVPFRVDGNSEMFDFFYIDPALSPAHGRYYAFSVYGTGGETALTEPLPIAPLAPPVLVSPAHGATCTDPTPLFTWTPPAGADSLHLFIYGSLGSGSAWLAGSATEYEWPAELTNGATYTWHIEAYKEQTDENLNYSLYWYSYPYSRTFTMMLRS